MLLVMNWDMNMVEVCNILTSIKISLSLSLSLSIVAVSSEKFGSGNMNNKIFLDGIRCRSNDTTLGRCLNHGFQTHNCIKSDILGLICTGEMSCDHHVIHTYTTPTILDNHINLCKSCTL